MANLVTDQMNTSESPMQNIEELGDLEALSKVTGAGACEAISGGALAGVGGAVAGGFLGNAIDTKKGSSTGTNVGIGVGAVSGAALGAALSRKAKFCEWSPQGTYGIFNLGGGR